MSANWRGLQRERERDPTGIAELFPPCSSSLIFILFHFHADYGCFYLRPDGWEILICFLCHPTLNMNDPMPEFLSSHLHDRQRTIDRGIGLLSFQLVCLRFVLMTFDLKFPFKGWGEKVWKLEQDVFNPEFLISNRVLLNFDCLRSNYLRAFQICVN